MESYPPPGPPPPPPTRHRLAALILRLLTVAFLVAALAVLTSDTGTMEFPYSISFRVHFKDAYSYRYLLGTCVLGTAYTLLQVVFVLFNISTGKRLANPKFDFYGDKVISYVLATGVGAGFGATRDLKYAYYGTNVDNFFDRGYASSGLVLVAFIFTAFLSICSSHNLPKKV